MIVYIDENLPEFLADGFNSLQLPENKRLNLSNPIEVRSIKQRFQSWR